MKRLLLLAPALLLIAAQTPPPTNGVIKPETNVDPNMRVVPPHAATRMPVVKPKAKQHGTVVVPK